MQRALIAALLAVLAVPVLAETEIRAITEMREGIRAKAQANAEWVFALSGDKEAGELAGFLANATLAYRAENGQVCDLGGASGNVRLIVLLRGEKRRLAPGLPDAYYDTELGAIVVSGIPGEKDLDQGMEMLMAARKARLSMLDERLADENLYRNWQEAFAKRIMASISRQASIQASR